MDPNKNEIELKQLVNRLIDGESDIGDAERLSKLIESDQELCDQYIAYMEVHARLSWGKSFSGEVENLKLDQLLLDNIPRVDQAEEKVALSNHHSTLGFLSDGVIQVRDFFMRTPILSSSISICVLICVVVAMAMIDLKSDQPDNEYIDYSNIKVARITDSSNIKWASAEDKLSLEAKLNGGQKINLASGVMEIQFEDGAIVVLEGPVEFELTTPGAGKLHLGKLFAYVPGRAVGFIVETPTAKVVDLGTRFGIKVSKDKSEYLEVTKGKVRLELGSKNSKTKSELLVEAGRSVDFGAGEKFSINEVTTPMKFIRRVPSNSSSDVEPEGRRIVIADPSFEKPNVLDGAQAVSVVWKSKPKNFRTVFDPLNNQFPGTNGDGVNQFGNIADGGQVGIVQNSKNSPNTSISQLLKESVIPGGKYTLQFWVGARADLSSGILREAKFRVQLLAGNNVILDRENPVIAPHGKGRVCKMKCKAPVDASGALTIRFSSTGSEISQTFLDDVRLYVQELAPKE